jgi:hypothetical protein
MKRKQFKNIFKMLVANEDEITFLELYVLVYNCSDKQAKRVYQNKQDKLTYDKTIC